MRKPVLIIGAAVAALASYALAQNPSPAPATNAPPPAAPRATGYLTADAAPKTSEIIPPPPVEGGDRQKADLDVFRATRALKDSPRWKLAQSDVSYEIPYLLNVFGCSIGADLTEQTAPKTAMLLRRVLRDTSLTSNSAKNVFMRKRPYLYVEGDICVAKTENLAASPDYPSGHATLSWASGLVLAELVPDRATQILTRARGYGESRIVCGVHSVSAVEQGRTTAAATVAAEHGSPEFRADMDAVRAELAVLRATTPSTGATCAADAALVAKPPY